MPPPSAPLGETIPASRKRTRKLTGSARAALISFSARYRQSPVAVPLLPLRSMPTATREDIIRPNFAMRLCRISPGKSNAELTSRLFPRHSLSWIRHKCWLRVVLLAYRQNIDRRLVLVPMRRSEPSESAPPRTRLSRRPSSGQQLRSIRRFSTLPAWRIRFLPSFCSSSSFPLAGCTRRISFALLARPRLDAAALARRSGISSRRARNSPFSRPSLCEGIPPAHCAALLRPLIGYMH
jgi:hypothetical protein